MRYALTEEELVRFDRDGFVGPFEVYSPEEIAAQQHELRLALLDRERAAYDIASAGSIANYDRHLDIPFLARHIRRAQIVDRVRSIIGDDLLCWRTEFFAKYPGDEGTDWHQSRNLAIGNGMPQLAATKPHDRYPEIFLSLGVWTAFTDSTVENGCMQYVPGSHRHRYFDDTRRLTWRPERINQVYKNGIKRGLFGYDSREIQIDRDWDPDKCPVITMAISAGQCVISWEATMHGSLPNTSSSSTRMAFVARYVPTNVCIYPHQRRLEEFGGTASLDRWRAVLVSGQDEYRYNPLEEGMPG